MIRESAREWRRPEEHYYAVADLSQRPRVIEDLPPDFSLVVPEIGPKTVILQILISELGVVDAVEIEAMNDEWQLPQEARDEIKMAVGKMRFLPGKIGEHLVKSRLHIEIMLEASTAFVEPGKESETSP